MFFILATSWKTEALLSYYVLIKTFRDQSGVRDAKQAATAKKRMRMNQKTFSKDGRQGESDRRILKSKPKHLFSGKRKMKADWR